MQPVTYKILLRDPEEGLMLFGPHDAFLKRIEAAMRAKIVSRNNEVAITGDPEEAQRVEQLFRVLLALIRKGFSLSEGDVQYAIELARRGLVDELVDLFHEEIGVTFKGKPIRVKTLGQRHYVAAMRKRDIVFAIGPAGTGKTFLAVVMAVNALKGGEVKRIVLTRPAVEAGENLGFLPGDLQEKVNPYLRPIYDALHTILGPDAVAKFIERGLIEIAPLAYMRGRTLDDSFIILDEAQNTTSEQMKMFLTRLGFGSKMVITGDVTQIDLPPGKVSGLRDAERVLRGIPEIAFIYLTQADVVRHTLVQKIIEAYEEQRETVGATAR